MSALDPRHTFLELVDPRELPDDLVESIRRFRFQGTSSKVNFALDGLPEYPALPGREDIFRGFTNIGPSIDYLERAFDEGKYGWYSSRPYIDGAIQSTIDPDMAPPGKHVMSCFIQYTPYQLRESDWDTEKENLGDTVQRDARVVLPGLRRPRPPARGRDAAPHRADGRALGGQHLRRRVLRARRCSSSARRRAGRSTARRSTATTSAARAPIREAASWAPRASSPPGGSRGPGEGGSGLGFRGRLAAAGEGRVEEGGELGGFAAARPARRGPGRAHHRRGRARRCRPRPRRPDRPRRHGVARRDPPRADPAEGAHLVVHPERDRPLEADAELLVFVVVAGTMAPGSTRRARGWRARRARPGPEQPAPDVEGGNVTDVDECRRRVWS